MLFIASRTNKNILVIFLLELSFINNERFIESKNFKVSGLECVNVCMLRLNYLL